jgi:fucose 4-O-acetylase-like acetyltransferase
MICGLVFLHLFELPGGMNDPKIGMSSFSYLIPEGINAWVHMAFMASVPFLSIISGYLFFRGDNFEYTSVFRKKFRTVMLPSWICCSLWFFLQSLFSPQRMEQ